MQATVNYLYRSGGRSSAANTLLRHPKSAVLSLDIEDGNSKFNLEISIAEAKSLVAELMDYVSDIEEYADYLKGAQA